MPIKMTVNSRKIKMTVGDAKTVYIGGEPYTGQCTVTPDTCEQILKTAQKLMPQDVIVNPVPYAEIPNVSGGNTAVIGGN